MQSIGSLLRKPREESTQLHYCIYDCFCLRLGSAPWLERWGWLAAYFTNYGRFFTRIWEVTTRSAKDEANVLSLHQTFVDEGFEGAIIRTEAGAYREDYRSPDLLKVKQWEDDEFRILDCVSGKGKFENQPIFSCQTREGKRFEVVPKGTAEERYEMLQNSRELLGQFLKVQYLGFTEDGKPRCARGIAIRDPRDMDK